MGNVRTEQLEAGDVSLDITGAGSADVRASDNLNVTITGAGAVRYTGDPKVTKKITGAGSVVKQS